MPGGSVVAGGSRWEAHPKGCMVIYRINECQSGIWCRRVLRSAYFRAMGFFDYAGAQGAYDQVYDDQRPRHEIGHELVEHHELGKELLAGFAAAELDKHLEQGYYDHLDREQLQQQAQQQANYLYDQQYGQQFDPNFDPNFAAQQYGQPVAPYYGGQY
jgi:Protein of unknown function (DUF3759)